MKHVISNHKTCLSNDESACGVDTEFTSESPQNQNMYPDMLDTGECAMEADFESNMSSIWRLTLKVT